MSEVLNQTQLEELIRAVLNEKLSAASLAESSYKQRASVFMKRINFLRVILTIGFIPKMCCL